MLGAWCVDAAVLHAEATPAQQLLAVAGDAVVDVGAAAGTKYVHALHLSSAAAAAYGYVGQLCELTLVESKKPTLYTYKLRYSWSTAALLRPATSSCFLASPAAAAPLRPDARACCCCCCTTLSHWLPAACCCWCGCWLLLSASSSQASSCSEPSCLLLVADACGSCQAQTNNKSC